MSPPRTRPLALITGASSGIGLSLAKQFAKGGFDLLLTGENPEHLAQAAQSLRSSNADIDTFAADLRTPNGVEALWSWCMSHDRPIEAAAVNAGIGMGGAFSDTPLEQELDLVALNVASTVHLSKRLVQHMRARGKGRILYTSSVSSEMRSPFEAVYGGSKSFIQSFSHSLREELKGSGVTVTSLLPGPTETNFFHRAQMDDTRVGQGKKDDPDKVARQGFKALMSNRPQVQAGGLKNRFLGAASRVLPEVVKSKMHRRMSEPLGSGHA